MTDTLNKTQQSRTVSDTPETDAILEQYNEFECGKYKLGATDLIKFAYKLERERDEAICENKKLLRQVDMIATGRDDWKRFSIDQEGDIKEWKAEAERWRSLAQAWKEEAVGQIKETHRLVEGIRAELRKNAHLADGDDCTLIGLKRLIGHEEGDGF